MFYVDPNFANLQYSHTVMFYVYPNFANLQYPVRGMLLACELPLETRGHTADLNVFLAVRTPDRNL